MDQRLILIKQDVLEKKNETRYQLEIHSFFFLEQVSSPVARFSLILDVVVNKSTGKDGVS